MSNRITMRASRPWVPMRAPPLRTVAGSNFCAQRALEGPLSAQERLLRLALAVTGSQAPLFGQTSTATGGGGSKVGDVLCLGLSIAGLPLGGGASLGGSLLARGLLG